jgi:hypothetical protein
MQMALSERQYASLLQSLDELRGAASYLGGTALDAAAAYQHACTRLSPAALHMLEAFKDFTPPPRVVAAASRASCDIERFPEDVLGALLAFVDLPMRFTCVVASRTLRDACMRLSPRLEYELVLKRFPLLTALPIRTSLAGVPAPRELFRSYRGRFNGRIFRAPQPNPTISLDAYTLALELRMREAEGPWESVYVGSGPISQLVPTGTAIGARFTIPEGLYERALDDPHVRFSANVMVSRRSRSGRLQFARLYSGVIDHNSGIGFQFDIDDLPYASDNTALNFVRFRADHTDNWTDPTLQLYWKARDGAFLSNVPEPGTFQRPRGPSFLFACFKWNHGITAEDNENMPERDIANCLEHFVDWSD